MATEIERKFLVTDDTYKQDATSSVYIQGYLSSAKGITVRVRIGGDKGFITIKGKNQNITRNEFEYEIPIEDARTMLATMCGDGVIHKRRFVTVYEGFTWEIDEFYDANEGLVVAEIELDHEEQNFSRPPWLGKEVSDNPRYYNANLVTSPYRTWKTGSKE